MTCESEILRRQLRAEVRRMAVVIRQIEEVIPGCFGEAAAVIRQQAAGDDVAPDDLTAALISVRLTLRDTAAAQEWHAAQVGLKAAEDEHAAWTAGGPLARAWRALIYRRSYTNPGKE
jgi:hypothetical protein